MPSYSEDSAYPNGVSSTGVCAVSDALHPRPITDYSHPGDIDQALSRAVAAAEARITAAQRLNEETSQSGDSWSLAPEPGRLSRIVCWTSRRQWISDLSAALDTDEGVALCRRRIRRVVVLAVARALGRFADSRTGRSVTASAATIAAIAARLLGRASLTPRTVYTARSILAELGYAVEVVRGRHLTAAERLAAEEHHGGHQTRAASTWALTVPRPRPGAQTVFHLPSCSSLSGLSTGSSASPKRGRANARRRAKAPSGRSHGQRRVQDQIVTAELLSNSTGLDTGKHLGSLVDVVTDLVDCERWTGRDLARTLFLDARTRGLSWPDTIDNPAGFLRHRLSGLAETLAGPSPSELEADHAKRARAEQAQRRAEQKEASEKRASSAHVASAVAQFREKLAQRRSARDASAFKRA